MPLKHGQPARVRLHFELRAPVAAASVAIGFNSLGGTRVLTYDMDQRVMRRDLGPGKYSVDVTIDPLILGPAVYDVDVGSRSGDFHPLDFVRSCAQLEVIAGPGTAALIAEKSPGVHLIGDWSWGPVSVRSQRAARVSCERS